MNRFKELKGSTLDDIAVLMDRPENRTGLLVNLTRVGTSEYNYRWSAVLHWDSRQ